MRSTFYGLEAARSGLYVSQNQLNTTGHNIANVDTDGYTRQRLSTAAIPAQYLNMQFAIDGRDTAGRGVTTVKIDQVRDQFLDAQFRQENTKAGYSSTTMGEFEIIESIFDSVLDSDTVNSGSISAALASFYSALNTLADNPSSKDLRTNLQQTAIQLTDAVNYIYTKLDEQHQNQNNAVKQSVSDINDLTSTIAHLNAQIYGYELSGAQANDLRDTRNTMIDNLSEIVDIEYYNAADGQLVITLGGRKLVEGAESYKLCADMCGENQIDVVSGVENPRTDQYVVKFLDEMGNPGKKTTDIAYIQGGSLKGYLDMRDGDTADVIGIPYVLSEMNGFCRKIAQEVNEVHRTGYTMPFEGTDIAGYTGSFKSHVMDANGKATVGANNTYLWKNIEEDTTATPPYYPSTTGVDFFYAGDKSDYSTVNCKNFSLSSEVMNNVYLIAASSEQVLVPHDDASGSNEVKGNKVKLTEVIELFNKEDALGNPDNFESRLTAVVTMVASAQTHYKNVDASQQTRLYALTESRVATSGVSLDEEMSDIIRFSHAYNASSRMITTIDEQLDTIINKMGTVGR